MFCHIRVNFWSPSDYYAFHGTPGAPFFFKLKAPRNAIGGFGYVASFSRLPDWLAWECFGEGNGAPTFEARGRFVWPSPTPTAAPAR